MRVVADTMLGQQDRCRVDDERQLAFRAVSLVAVPTAVPLSRALVRFSLIKWGFRELVDDAELLVSELATNAVQASASESVLIRPHIALYPTRLRVAVWDRTHLKPELKEADDEVCEGGRGLLLVDALSSEWGYYMINGRPGKVVWADLALFAYGYDQALLERVRDGLARL